MCGTFGQKEPNDLLSKMIAKSRDSEPKLKWNPIVKPNQIANIYTSKGVKEAVFGFVLGELKDGKKKFWVNARTEYFANPENSKQYKGPFEIFNNKEIGPLLKSSRAIIPAAHFFEAPDDAVHKTFFIAPNNGDDMFFGGVYIDYFDPDSGEIKQTRFCILTTAANKATSYVGHARCPLLIDLADADDFLRDDLTESDLAKYFSPNNNLEFKCFEIDKSQLQPNNLFTPNSSSDFTAITEPVII